LTNSQSATFYETINILIAQDRTMEWIKVSDMLQVPDIVEAIH
jgi:hypothetical protein